MKKKIIFSGGGSGGHVTPALALIEKLKELDYEIAYIGGRDSIEYNLIKNENIKYFTISTGKLRRYFSFKNLIDIFKIIWGILQSCFIVFKYFYKDGSILFATGGFVSVPPVIAFWIFKKKIIIHEQTSRVGLANQINGIFAHKILLTFESSKKYFPPSKSRLTGYPLRHSILANKNLKDYFSNGKSTIYVTGGGNGSKIINDCIKNNFKLLTDEFNLIHQTGSRFINDFKNIKHESYLCSNFFNSNEISSIYAKADIILTRAGANTVCELMALNKKTIFIPLKIAQKNEQYYNALEAQKKIKAKIILEDELNLNNLLNAINELLQEKAKKHTEKDPTKIKNPGLENIIQEIRKAAQDCGNSGKFIRFR